MNEKIKNLSIEEKIEFKCFKCSRSREALEVIQRYNHVNNDLQAYLYEVGKYGLGERDDMPKSEDYGF
jgi:hypothetical protein